jgi:hypothetical protein
MTTGPVTQLFPGLVIGSLSPSSSTLLAAIG